VNATVLILFTQSVLFDIRNDENSCRVMLNCEVCCVFVPILLEILYTYYTEMTAVAVKCNNKLKCFTVSQSVHACCYIVARSQLHQLVYSSFPHVTVLCLLNSMAVLFVSNNCHSCTSTVSCPQCIKQFHHHTYWVQCDILMCSCRRIVHQTALL